MNLPLHAQRYGEQGGPLLILHGLFGSSRNWQSIARQLAETHQVFTLDLRNHGDSPWHSQMDYPAMAEDLRCFMDSQDLAQVALLGHSMGGKVAMYFALLYPQRVSRLIIIDIAPVAYQHSFRDLIQAMRHLDLDQVQQRREADAALTPAIPNQGVRQFLLQNLVSDATGGLRWRLNLAVLEKAMPTLLDFPDCEGLIYSAPTLFLGGEKSTYLQTDAYPRIRQLFPQVTIQHIANAGHWIHAEQPQHLLARLRSWWQD